MSGASGLAPTPEQLQALRVAKEREKSTNSEESGGLVTVRASSPSLAIEVRALNYSLFWQYQKRILDLVEVAITNDRQWTILRKAIQNVQSEQLEVTNNAFTRKISDYQDAKEAKNARVGNEGRTPG